MRNIFCVFCVLQQTLGDCGNQFVDALRCPGLKKGILAIFSSFTNYGKAAKIRSFISVVFTTDFVCKKLRILQNSLKIRLDIFVILR